VLQEDFMSLREKLGEIKSAALTKILGVADKNTIPLEETEHTKLSLSDDPSLYDPSHNLPMQRGELPIYIINNATVWPDQSVAAVNGKPIFETFIDEKRIRLATKRNFLRRYPVRSIPGYITTIDYMYSAHNYYHQMIDSIPRLWALHHPFFRDLEITLCIPRHLSGDQQALIGALIPENVTIKRVSKHTRLRPETGYIHLPYLSKDRVNYNRRQSLTSPGFLPREYVDYFRELVFDKFDTSAGNSPSKFYITRANYSKRHFLNESEIRDYLSQHNFKTIDTGALSLGDQAQLFRNSEIIIAQLGAALTNTIFCDSTFIIEVFPSHHNLQHFSVAAKAFGLNYKAIQLDGNSINDDVYLPVSKLENLLSAVEQ